MKTTSASAHASTERVRASLRRRYAAERRFRAYGIVAIMLALLGLATLFVSIIGKGHTAFVQTHILASVHFDEKAIDPEGKRDADVLSRANYNGLIRASLRDMFPEVKSRGDKKSLYGLISGGAAFDLREMVMDDPDLIGQTRDVWLVASDDVDMVVKGHVSRDIPESERRFSDKEMGWLSTLESAGRVETHFNTRLFTAGDSREPELAGIGGAAIGSLLTMAITLLLAFPLGVAAAIYLEEFAKKNRWSHFIEVNINNLAAVPSIVYGLLGLAVFLVFMELPRSAPLVGGLVLALMTLPTIIIAGRAALKAVPPSIREGALGVGASRVQTVFHHILPLAMPGILTGTIIGMARALGETAPLLMI
ncbi:MAG: phosphate ABC transporter permease PstA, partial [Rhodospirillales bacterium]|nr:phosphate ABC transporter permease PstA [Rhodospirillales bacterium]